MEHRGVQILEYSDTEYCFAYLGRLINDHANNIVTLEKGDDHWINKHKAEGFIDCLIALGEV